MQTIARAAIRYRWRVIVGWLVFILGAQGITSALGGAQYRDEFSLPHTETNTVVVAAQVGQPEQPEQPRRLHGRAVEDRPDHRGHPAGRRRRRAAEARAATTRSRAWRRRGARSTARPAASSTRPAPTRS